MVLYYGFYDIWFIRWGCAIIVECICFGTFINKKLFFRMNDAANNKKSGN